MKSAGGFCAQYLLCLIPQVVDSGARSTGLGGDRSSLEGGSVSWRGVSCTVCSVSSVWLLKEVGKEMDGLMHKHYL